MKKLAKLTALLLTGVMLLLLASCGAAPNPLTPEQQARQEIFNAINEVRQKAGKSLLQEVPALTQLEQEFIENFRKAGTKGIPSSEADQLYNELQKKQKEAGWENTGSINYDNSNPAKLDTVYEGDTPEFRKELIGFGFANSMDSSTALSIGVVTIEGKIYWTASILVPKT